MELSKSKKKLEVTRRGHHLLKDKFDSLVKTFLESINEFLDYQQYVSNELLDILNGYANVCHSMSNIELDQQLFTSYEVILTKTTQIIMNVEIPQLECSIKGDAVNTLLMKNSILVSIKKLKDFFPKFIKLASLEKKCYILASEIEKTRRRVNAIEYILIPDIEQSIKVIKLHLMEAEISNQVRIMKSKDMIATKLALNAEKESKENN
jgi:V/A-type H+-transporting ATPase subunit D